MKYPTIEQANAADRLQICKWHRFLSSPIDEEQSAVLHIISTKFKDFGGFTPELSKAVGWEEEPTGWDGRIE